MPWKLEPVQYTSLSDHVCSKDQHNTSRFNCPYLDHLFLHQLPFHFLPLVFAVLKNWQFNFAQIQFSLPCLRSSPPSSPLSQR